MNTYIALARDSRLTLCLLAALTGEPAKHDFTLALRSLSIEKTGRRFSELGLNFWRVLRWTGDRITLESTIRTADGQTKQFVLPEFAPTADLDKVGKGTLTEEIIKALLLEFIGCFYLVEDKCLQDEENRSFSFHESMTRLGFDDVSLNYGNPVGSLLSPDWTPSVIPVVTEEGIVLKPYYGPTLLPDSSPSSNVVKGDIGIICTDLLSKIDLRRTKLVKGFISAIGPLDPTSTESSILIPWRKS